MPVPETVGPSIRRPVVLELPMCNRANGAVSPIPTLVSAVALLTPLMLPSTKELLAVTSENAPIAVALVRVAPASIPAMWPRPVL